MFAPRNTIGLKYGFACISPPVLAPVFPFPAHTFLLCPHISDISQYRNFNLLSIGYVFRPRLRPRLPRADQLYPGNLRYSALKILTSISLLIPAFSLLSSPPLLPVWLRSANNAPLPTFLFLSFGVVFQPRTFSAQDLSTSELLRTLLMCGCF